MESTKLTAINYERKKHEFREEHHKKSLENQQSHKNTRKVKKIV